MAYYYTFKFHHFNTDDKVYVAPDYFSDKTVGALGAMRIIRPLTKGEIDNLPPYSYKHNVKPEVDNLSKPYAINTGIYFDLNTMKKVRSGCIGTFIKYSVVYVKDAVNKNAKVAVILCAIKPNRTVFREQWLKFNYFIPDNFINTDSTVYVDPFQISDSELPAF